MIRAATAADYEAVIALSRELGTDDPDPTREAWIARQLPTTLVCERDGAPVGYLHFVPLANVAHVRQVAVAGTARRAGIGRELMRAAAAELRGRGFATWQLNVKETNAPAIALYAGFGLRPDYRAAWLRIDWSAVVHLPAEPATTAGVTPDEDAAIEQRFAIAAGRLALARSRDHVVVQLRDASACIAVACFDPAFPGAYVFATARPSLARTLLDALQPHARAAHLGIIVSDDAALEAALVAAGGRVRFHVIHYRGAIP